MRTIAIVNESSLVSMDDVAQCAAALQTQVSRDFAATWGIDASLRVAADADKEEEILYLLDDARQADALGHQSLLSGPRPCGFVFVRPCLEAEAGRRRAASPAVVGTVAGPRPHLPAIHG